MSEIVGSNANVKDGVSNVNIKAGIEFNMSKTPIGGRSYIKMTALEIHENEDSYNENGLTWLENTVADNLASIKGMPYVVSWLDRDEGIPSDHGYIGHTESGELRFDGDPVGEVEEAYIDYLEIDGVTKKVLVTEGYIYNQRNAKFVEFLKSELAMGKIYGSIEICGKGHNRQIVYQNGQTNPDGSKKMGRIPTEFDFSGLAILYMTRPADSSSQILEVAQKQDLNQLQTSKTQIKEEDNMEINYKEEYEKGLKTIAKLEGADQETEINTLNDTVKDLTTANTELNNTVTTVTEEAKTKQAKIDELETELNAANLALAAIELEKAQAAVDLYWTTDIELNDFSDEETVVLKAFKADADLDGLKAKEAELCAKHYKEQRLADAGKDEEDADGEFNSHLGNAFTVDAINKKAKNSGKDDAEFVSFL